MLQITLKTSDGKLPSPTAQHKLNQFLQQLMQDHPEITAIVQREADARA